MRLFIAIQLPDDVRAKLERVQESLRPIIKAKWTPPEQMHLTLKFLGETPDRDLPKIILQLNAIAINREMFLSSGGVVCFPPQGSIRIVAAELKDEGERCAAVQEEIDGACQSAGFRLEGRRWRPHVTLGRVKDRVGAPVRGAVMGVKPQPFEFAVNSFSLIESRLDHAGPSYARVAEFR